MALSTSVINVLNGSVDSFSWTGSQISLCCRVVAVPCVVDQSVPTAHPGDKTLAHFVLCFCLVCEVEWRRLVLNKRWKFNCIWSIL